MISRGRRDICSRRPYSHKTDFTRKSGIWITGGLHFDGLMDTADGIAAGPEKCLFAMQDSRVGASGVLALIIILLVQIITSTHTFIC